VLPGDYKWATKRSIMRVPFLGWHLSIAGHVPVDRGAGEHAIAETIRRFVQVLRDGKPLLIFPEGTRSEDGRMQPFKNGGFYAAVRAGVPVVPVALNGTHRLMKRGGTDTGEELIKPVHVKVGPPVHPRQDGSESDLVIDLRDRTFDAVADLLKSIGGLTHEGSRRHEESAEVRASA
jgi:1-acyl-sn-glycerol-3-phosphate acyltransferase